MKAPVLVLGCSDCLYRLDDTAVPRQFVHASSMIGLSDQAYFEAVEQGRRILSDRIGGALDSAIDYMPTSPFTSADTSSFWSFPGVGNSFYEERGQSDSGPGRKGFVVIFMHELQDWQHNGVLPPFATSYYEWLFMTAAFMLENDIPFIIKIHPAIVAKPNRYSQTIHAICNMVRMVGAALPISTASTTLQLAQQGMHLGLTVRGTIALEMAFLHLRFMCAGRPPYASLFPRRMELDPSSYKKRLINFMDEPQVSAKESELASFYVGRQHSMMNRPVTNLTDNNLALSPVEDFVTAKGRL